MTYIVARVNYANNERFFTARKDDRTVEEINRQRSQPSFEREHSNDLYNKDAVSVDNLYTGLTKEQADTIKNLLIEADRTAGLPVLNAR